MIDRRSLTQIRSLRRELLPGLPLLLTIASILIAVGIANATGLIIGNPTTSVPRGIYYAAAPERAEYVSFCLGRQHRHADYYAYFCSPDQADGIRILKQIARHPDRAGRQPTRAGQSIHWPCAPGPDTRLVATTHPDRNTANRRTKMTNITIAALKHRTFKYRCPPCQAVLATTTPVSFITHGQRYLYNDGDTILGLGSRLMAHGLIPQSDFDDADPETWFDYGRVTGNCSNCMANYCGAKVSMVNPGAKLEPEFQEMYFLHNIRHEYPTTALAKRKLDTGHTEEWCVDIYHTSAGVVHEHDFGPFAWPDDTLSNWLGNFICERWSDMKAAVVAADCIG